MLALTALVVEKHDVVPVARGRTEAVDAAGREQLHVDHAPEQGLAVVEEFAGRCAVPRVGEDLRVLALEFPGGEEECNANMLLTIIDDQNSNTEIRSFQQMIFAQDKPILENQVPKRLPLDLRAETSVRCDATSTAYRRWLHKRDVRFGTIPQS